MGRPKSSYFLWILGHILRGLFVLLVMGICTVLIWRLAFSRRVPKDLKYIAGNEVLREALVQNDGNLTLLTQPDQVRYTEADYNYADYHVKDCVFFEEAKQAQFVFYYNNSTLEEAGEKVGADLADLRGEEVFSLELLLCTDVTPEGHEGEPVVKETVVVPTSVEMDHNSLYTFARYTFDGVELDGVTVVYLDIYYEQNGEREELGTIRLYHEQTETERRELSKKEIKQIKE